jgi:hypothetical protein
MATSLSTSTHYMLQPSLIDLHQKSIEWESNIELWKRELAFFKKLIDEYGKELHRRDDVEERNHFKLLLNFYANDLMGSLTAKIQNHETSLKPLMKNRNSQDESTYRSEHKTLSYQIRAFEKEFLCYKNELYLLMEKVLKIKTNEEL